MCDDQVEQRRIRSLNRQRANVRPINSSHLPLEQRNPFGTGAAGGDGMGTSHGKKLGQVEVEPIEVRCPSKTALPCLSLVCATHVQALMIKVAQPCLRSRNCHERCF